MFKKGYWKGNKIKNMSNEYIINCINYLKKHPLCDEDLEVCDGWDGIDTDEACCIKWLKPNEEKTNKKIEELENELKERGSINE